MNFLNKMERKFGRFAIPNLINYIVVLVALGGFLGMVSPYFYIDFLMLDVGKVLKGQVWRLFTFILEPQIGGMNPINLLFFAFLLYMYFLFGRSLENAWGAFRFNLYFFSGVLLSILAAFLVYFTTGDLYYVGLTYIYQAMFLAFASLYPNVQFLLFFIIPVKVKWLAYLEGFYLVYTIIDSLLHGNFVLAIAILVSLANFLLFFFLTRNYKRFSPREQKRRRRYKMQVQSAKEGARHKCTICGRTGEEDETLEFRYCSKCDGNYEYCMEHLFTHPHVHK